MQISVETTIAAPIAEVWRAYTTPADIMQWNAASDDWRTTAASVDLREGGAFSSRMEAKDGSFGFDFAGTYTKIVPHALIEYALGDRNVRVDFAGSDGAVTVRVTFDAEDTHSIDQQRDGWQAILNRFKGHVEGVGPPDMQSFLAIFTATDASRTRSGWGALGPDEFAARRAAGVAAWSDWVARNASSLVDPGAPIGKTKRADASGLSDSVNAITAYCIVRAESHEAAARLFENHPHFTHFPGDAVEIMPILALPQG